MNIHADSLKSYRVTLCEAEDDGFLPEIIFECWAEDAGHAREQAENAYPDCMINGVFDQ